jgi:hypothetical protein
MTGRFVANVIGKRAIFSGFKSSVIDFITGAKTFVTLAGD